MSFRATTLWRHLFAALLIGPLSGHALAQVANSPVVFVSDGGITTSFVQTANYGGSDHSTPGNWFKVEFHYAVIPAVGDYLDSVTFKVWVEGRDLLDPQGKPGEGIAVALTGQVTYVNVPKGKDVYGVVYVHPSAIGRYSGSGGQDDFERKFNVHVEADVANQPVDVYDKNKETDPNWYQPLKPIPGLLFLQNQSPFILTDPDRYPELKLPASA